MLEALHGEFRSHVEDAGADANLSQPTWDPRVVGIQYPVKGCHGALSKSVTLKTMIVFGNKFKPIIIQHKTTVF
jgi:hypothetical protein